MFARRAGVCWWFPVFCACPSLMHFFCIEFRIATGLFLCPTRFPRAVRHSYQVDMYHGHFWVCIFSWCWCLVLVPELCARPPFLHLFRIVFRTATALFSPPLLFPAPHATRISKMYVLAAFECVFLRGAGVSWWCPSFARATRRACAWCYLDYPNVNK
jgi:hypothetical protein